MARRASWRWGWPSSTPGRWAALHRSEDAGRPARYSPLAGADLDEETAWSLVGELLDRCLADLLRMREQEGKALLTDLTGRIDNIREHLHHIDARAPLRVTEAERGSGAASPNFFKVEVHPERIILEASFIADRLDCTEEAVRLRSHCEQFLEISRGKDSRKLNFLIQEMNREVDTARPMTWTSPARSSS